MPFSFEPNKIYEMPVFFGPSVEPKNPRKDGSTWAKPADVEAATVMFETDADKLASLLPEGFTLAEPVLSVAACEFGHLGNFAGNTYYLINISCPVSYDGERDHVQGDLVLAMYENHAEPIMGGRELLGYSKIYADITRFAKTDDAIRLRASDWGFTFLKLDLDLNGTPEDPAYMDRIASRSQGKLNYKYIQSCPEKGQKPWEAGVDASYPVINPKADLPVGYPYQLMKPQVTRCTGMVEFVCPTETDMPFYWHIAKFFSELPVKRVLGAQFSVYQDPTDYTNLYRLR